MVDVLGVALGAFLAVLVVGFHVVRGKTWQPREDITEAVLSHRAATVPATDFPEPMNRSIGGGGAVGAIGGGEAGGELEPGEEETGTSPADIPDDEAAVFDVEYVKEGATLEVRENQTLLEAGEEQGWDLPYACREGQCLSCGGHITNGPAEDFIVHDGQEMLSGEELDNGYTLTCVAYPKADLTLETREAP